jgi:hypothetical protein
MKNLVEAMHESAKQFTEELDKWVERKNKGLAVCKPKEPEKPGRTEKPQN